MGAIQFIQTNPDELLDKINKLQSDRDEGLLKRINSQLANDDLMTREETCKFLKIDSSTLWSWTKKGKVTAYGIGNRRYYKRSEILSSLTPLKK